MPDLMFRSQFEARARYKLSNFIRELEKDTVLGRPIRLADVLLAIKKKGGNVWENVDKAALVQTGISGLAMPANYEAFRLDSSVLREILKSAPEEYRNGREVILSLPMPDGTYSRFRIENSLVVERGLLKKFPELGETFRGQGIDDPTATVRFDFLPSGFHSMILS